MLGRCAVVNSCLYVLKKGLPTGIGWPQMSKLGQGWRVPHLLRRNFIRLSKACSVERLQRLVFIDLHSWLFNFETKDVPSFPNLIFRQLAVFRDETS